MANNFLTPDVIAREALVLLESNMVAAQLMSRDTQQEFTGGERVGDTIRVRRRDKGQVTQYNGSTVTPTDVVESSVNVTLERHFDANIRVTSREMTLSIQDFSSQILEPYLLEMAEQIDTYALSKLNQLPNVAGNSRTAPTNLPNSIAAMASVERTANDQRMPRRPRYQVVSTEYKETLLGVDNFTRVDTSGDTAALREASLGNLMGFESFMDQNVDTSTHTSGTATTGAVNGGLAKGVTSIVVDGFVSGSTMLAGDVITIAGYGNAVVAADVTLAGGAGTVTVYEPLTDAVADNAAITVYDAGGNDRENHGAIFHPRAFALAVVPLALPQGAASSFYIQDRGFGIRAVYDYDRGLKSDVLSLDILVGIAMVDGRLGAQIVKDI